MNKIVNNPYPNINRLVRINDNYSLSSIENDVLGVAHILNKHRFNNF